MPTYNNAIIWILVQKSLSHRKGSPSLFRTEGETSLNRLISVCIWSDSDRDSAGQRKLYLPCRAKQHHKLQVTGVVRYLLMDNSLLVERWKTVVLYHHSKYCYWVSESRYQKPKYKFSKQFISPWINSSCINSKVTCCTGRHSGWKYG